MVYDKLMMKFLFGFFTALMLSVLAYLYMCSNSKTVVGESELMQVSGVPYIARIDTGASVSSLHAYHIKIDQMSEVANENIGKSIHFSSSNEQGSVVQIDSVIKDVKNVRNAQGIENRYVIELPITWQGETRMTRVNLRDRSQMSYKLLIGRNWLEGRYVVDVNHGTTINSATKAK